MLEVEEVQHSKTEPAATSSNDRIANREILGSHFNFTVYEKNIATESKC